ncbi:hypothetical protein CV102_14365 [Natronococcus pandeyae]|uniref:Methyltransferase domain-containing protein n=1 Tax=Natronococcus pandeyae TaxID=2055836 RepID=A0A8J8Q3Q1_9EURY|nr:class I SAM-dependent methyltransferase [Natronococcus pandeyae]TYL37908.1 hypothetical protein CV102_14365 [Natronococcus pandeyae]
MSTEPTAALEEAWSTGSYVELARNYRSMAAQLVERTAVDSSDEVLDVGCGTGNVAITAARRGARVSGLDVAPVMLERARENAEIAGVDDVEWHEGDATDLPFEENAVDVTLSSLGHMYGDPPDAAARELLRVTRPGGRIGFTAWTPTGLFPKMAGLVAARLSPDDRPEFSEPPFAWGDPDVVTQRLGATVDELTFRAETVLYPALSPAHFWRELVAHSGLFITYIERVDDRPELREAVLETIESHFDDGENAVELEYRSTTATVPESN